MIQCTWLGRTTCSWSIGAAGAKVLLLESELECGEWQARCLMFHRQLFLGQYLVLSLCTRPFDQYRMRRLCRGSSSCLAAVSSCTPAAPRGLGLASTNLRTGFNPAMPPSELLLEGKGQGRSREAILRRYILCNVITGALTAREPQRRQ